MRTVNEVSKLTGVSVRTLHYYDSIGLLKPTMLTESDYRLYDEAALERLQNILLFRELEFSLKEIKEILDSPDFDREKALEQQMELLIINKERLENLIDFTRKVKTLGGKGMDFKAFDSKKMDEYSRQAKASWGKTDAYKEFEKKTSGKSKNEMQVTGSHFMNLFIEFASLKNQPLDSEPVQNQVKKIQDFITENYYTCTDQILAGLGQMYSAGGEMTENIDQAAGEGTAEFISKAIKIYCGK